MNSSSLSSDVGAQVESGAVSTRESVAAYVELTKPRITTLVVLTAAAGFCLGSKGGMNYVALANLSIGIALLCSGISALNQYIERELDGLMRRTETRPLPSGKLSPMRALLFGTVLCGFATAYLALAINPLTSALGVFTLASYLFLYTPLKTRTSLSTVVGAVPGAMPPFIGWVAARGEMGIEAWVLFAILFLWQFPHFLAIAWMYRDDYSRAGIKMLPVIEPDCRVTGQQIVIYALALLPISLLPVLVRVAGNIYLYGAIVLGSMLLYYSVRAAVVGTKWQARRLLLASVLYLPALFGLMVLNRL